MTIFFVKEKCEKLLQCKSSFHCLQQKYHLKKLLTFFSTKNISAFGYSQKTINELPHNELVKLTML